MKNDSVITVSQLNCYLKSLIDSDVNLNSIFLKGEISNFTNHYKSGHFYFSLKDEKSIIKAIMFSSSAHRVKFKPDDGMSVIVRGKVSIYEATGQYQMYVEDMQPDGLGALNLAFEQLKNKLQNEGLFNVENKKELPRFPNKIGVITSDTGAAIKDIQEILNRRYPLATLVVCPVLVQGDNAPAQIIDAIKRFNNSSAADVLIVGRGGGSIEDLWAFNDEGVARAVAMSKIPIISAVGHETDFTICDFAADLRAPTPSAAAELVVPNIEDLMDDINKFSFIIRSSIKFIIEEKRRRVDNLLKCYQLKKPLSIVNSRSINLDLMVKRLNIMFTNTISKEKEKFICISSKLDTLSPLKVLFRGYAIVTKSGKNKVVKDKNKIKLGEELTIKLYNGEIDCKVEDIR